MKNIRAYLTGLLFWFYVGCFPWTFSKESLMFYYKQASKRY